MFCIIPSTTLYGRQNTAIAFLAVPSGGELDCCIRDFMSRMQCEVIELNVQPDHVHMVAWIQARLSVSEVTGTVKGKTAIHVFRQFPWLRRRPYWGNNFWAEGYCVDTVGLDEEKIRLYVKWQEEKERREERRRGDLRQGLLNL